MTHIIQGQLNAEGKRFGILVSRFNEFITKRLLEGALDCIHRRLQALFIGAKYGDIANLAITFNTHRGDVSSINADLTDRREHSGKHTGFVQDHAPQRKNFRRLITFLPTGACDIHIIRHSNFAIDSKFGFHHTSFIYGICPFR